MHSWQNPRLPGLHTSHLRQLGLKWRSAGEVREDFKGYLVLSASGELLATGASKCYADSQLEIWNTEAQTLVQSHDTDNSSSSAFVWLTDNRYLTGSNDSLIRLWNEGRCEAEMTGHRDWVRSLALSSGDEWLLSGGLDGEIRRWDVGRLAGVDEMVVGGNAPMNSIQGVSFNVNDTGCFVITREGVLCGYDLRSHHSLFPSVPAS